MTAAAPRVGGTLTTAEQLDALPDKAVVLDEHEEPWQKLGEGLWCGSAGGPMSGTALLRTRTDEVTVLYVPGEQPRPSATDNARAEAWRRFPDGIDVETGEPVDDYGYPATAREAFIAGAEWAAARAETTDERVVHNHGPTDGPGLDCPETILPDGGLRGACLNRDETTTATTEDAARVLYRELRLRLPEALAPADEVTDWTTWKHIVTEVAGLLATARTRPTETEGTRWWVPAYRTPEPNSRVQRLGSPTVLREYAERAVEQYRKQEAEDPKGNPDAIFLATRIQHPWTEADQ